MDHEALARDRIKEIEDEIAELQEEKDKLLQFIETARSLGPLRPQTLRLVERLIKILSDGSKTVDAIRIAMSQEFGSSIGHRRIMNQLRSNDLFKETNDGWTLR